MTERVPVGAYAPPTAKAQKEGETVIVDKRPKIETPTTNLHEGIREELKLDVDGAKENVAKAKSYKEILEEHEIPLDKARAIVDSMLTEGFYTETISVTQSSTVTFRTRTYEDYRRYLRAVELINPRFVEEQQEIMARYYLAASVVAFKGKSFAHPSPQDSEQEKEEAFTKRMNWLNAQPERVINLLVSKLSKFDTVISVVMSEGVVENF